MFNIYEQLVMGKFKELAMGYGDEKDEFDDIFGEMLPKSSVDLLHGKSSDSGSKRECSWHDWHNYVGLIESYQYCTHCDAKKPINE
jgi:hypothetical protein